jgi:hypothetical protein
LRIARFAPSALFARNLHLLANGPAHISLRCAKERNFMKTVTAAKHVARRLPLGAIALLLLLSGMVLMLELQ